MDNNNLFATDLSREFDVVNRNSVVNLLDEVDRIRKDSSKTSVDPLESKHDDSLPSTTGKVLPDLKVTPDSRVPDTKLPDTKAPSDMKVPPDKQSSDQQEHNKNKQEENVKKPSKAEMVVDKVKGVLDEDKEAAKSPNQFDRESLELINKFRRKHDLPALKFDPRLQLIARVHSRYQDKYGLGHDENRPGWQSPADRMSRVGMGSRFAGECAGYGPIRSPKELVQMWIDSPPHREILLSPDAHFAGVSKYKQGATFNISY